MKPTYHYTTVLDALNDLKKKGFNVDYNFHHQAIITNPADYAILHIYRYEGDSDPDEEAIVYGIISQSGQKGFFVSGFSANSDDQATQILYNIAIE